MKQLFLLIAAAVFALGANAQQATDAAKLNQKKLRFDSEYQRTTPPPTINYSEELKATTLEKIFIGKAHSQRSFRREDCRNVAYNKDLDMITVTFIIDEETYPDVALSDGSVGIFYSIDHGQTWAGPVLLSDLSDQEKRNYYCSGNIYNPGGNAVIEDAYGVYQGIAPDNPGGTIGDWNNQAFGATDKAPCSRILL